MALTDDELVEIAARLIDPGAFRKSGHHTSCDCSYCVYKRHVLTTGAKIVAAVRPHLEAAAVAAEREIERLREAMRPEAQFTVDGLLITVGYDKGYAAGVAAERERAAKVAEDFVKGDCWVEGKKPGTVFVTTARRIAAAIRAEGGPAGGDG